MLAFRFTYAALLVVSSTRMTNHNKDNDKPEVPLPFMVVLIFLLHPRSLFIKARAPSTIRNPHLDPSFKQAIESLAAIKLHKYAVKRKEQLKQRTNVRSC